MDGLKRRRGKIPRLPRNPDEAAWVRIHNILAELGNDMHQVKTGKEYIKLTYGRDFDSLRTKCERIIEIIDTRKDR